jgi:hypothetical protein
MTELLSNTMALLLQSNDSSSEVSIFLDREVLGLIHL